MESPYQYQVKLPANMEEGKKYPVIFALHGIGYKEQYMLDLLEELKEKAILISVRGDLPYEKGYAYYYLHGYGNPDRELFDKSIKSLTEFIEYAVNNFPIDPNNKYIIGFSQGAVLSISLALFLGDSIKGIVPLNGFIPEFVKEDPLVKSISHLSVFLCHGAKDTVFPLQIGHEIFDYLSKRAGSVKYSIYPTGHKILANNQQDIVAWLREELKNI